MTKYDGYLQYQISFVDLQGQAISTGLAVTVHKSGVATAATIYADRYQTALTNPITSTVFDAVPGVVTFFTDAPVVDLTLTCSNGMVYKYWDITPSVECLRIPKNNGGIVPLYILPSAGTTKTSWTTRVALGLATYTIPANFLKPGDMLHVYGVAYCLAANGTDTHLYDIGYGTNVLGASGAVNATAGDIWPVELWISIRTATTAMVTGNYCATSAAVGTCVTKPYWLAEITIDTTAAAILAMYCTASASSAGNQVRADQFIVELLR